MRPMKATSTTPCTATAVSRLRWAGLALLLAVWLAPALLSANPFGLGSGGGPGPESSVESGAAPDEGAVPWTTLERASNWILQTQRDLHRRLTLGLHQLDETPTAMTAGALILASFLYGIFHAAGPGHGKAVISTYLLTHRQSLRRGIGLSVAAALMQGVTAITAVLVLIGGFGWLARDTIGQVRNLELASFLLVALLGVWLIGRGLRALWRLHRSGTTPTPERGLVLHANTADHQGLAATVTPGAPRFQRLANTTGTPGHPLRGPAGPRPIAAPDCGCGTPHHVDPNLRGPWYATVFAVGIRPCSGAVLVMAVSYLLGLWLAGIAAVLAMSLGTALTVAVIAVLAVQARDWTRRLLQPTGWSGLRYAGPLIGLVGGGVIFFVGWTLLQGTLTLEPVRHPLGL